MKLMTSINKHFRVLSKGISMRNFFPQWHAWFMQEKYSKTRTQDLLEKNVKDEYKAMAITVLLIPYFKWLPKGMFKCSYGLFRYVDNELLVEVQELKAFSRPLLTFTVEMLCACVSYMNNARKLDQHVAGYEKRQILKSYNAIIRKILSFMDIEDPLAQKLFEHFLLNEPMPWTGKDLSYSKYNEFSGLMYDATIPNSWKVRADQDMCSVVEGELSGKTIARDEKYPAVERYVDHIKNRFSDHYQNSYSSELALSQLEFIVDIFAKYADDYFEMWPKYEKALAFLEGHGESTMALRETFITAMIRSASFTIGNEHGSIFYQYVLDSYRLDEKDCLKIQKMILKEITNRNERLLAEAKSSETKKTTEQEILASMQ